MKSIRIISLLIVICCIGYRFIIFGYQHHSIVVQNEIIDNSFKNGDFYDYLGYIEIPRFNIRRLIKYGTDSSVLDSLYVGMFYLSHDIDSDDLIILAGHNVSIVFSRLHDILIGDYVYLGSISRVKKFIVYDKRIVSDSDFSFFDNRYNELLLITCDREGYRLLVFLREVL